MKKYAQNRIAESRWALSVSMTFGFFVSFVTTIWQLDNYEGSILYFIKVLSPTALFLLSAVLMAALNNVYALIRVYSRMVSCAFLFLSSAACFQFASWRYQLFMVCMVAFVMMLFSTYQDRYAPGKIMYAFSFLGVASMLFPQVVYLVPIVWLMMPTQLMNASWRTYAASVIGVIMPYWFIVPISLHRGEFESFEENFKSLGNFQGVLDLSILNNLQIITLTFIVVIAIVGTCHFYRNAYKDKIRTRMFFNFFFAINFAAMLFLALQPQHFSYLIGVCILCTSVFVGHFIALTSTRLTNMTFFVMLALVIALTAINFYGYYVNEQLLNVNLLEF